MSVVSVHLLPRSHRPHGRPRRLLRHAPRRTPTPGLARRLNEQLPGRPGRSGGARRPSPRGRTSSCRRARPPGGGGPCCRLPAALGSWHSGPVLLQARPQRLASSPLRRCSVLVSTHVPHLCVRVCSCCQPCCWCLQLCATVVCAPSGQPEVRVLVSCLGSNSTTTL